MREGWPPAMRAPLVVYGTAPWDAPWLTEHHLAWRLADERSVVFVQPPMSLASPLRYGVKGGLGGARRMLRTRRRVGRLTVLQPLVLPPLSHPRMRSVSSPLVARAVRAAVRQAGGPSSPPPIGLIAGGFPEYVGVGGERSTIFLLKDLNEDGAALIGRDAGVLRSETDAQAAAAELVVVISERLRQTLAQRGFESRLLRHGFDAELTQVYADAAPPPEYADLPRPLVGYAGRIDGRLDLSAMIAVAERFAEGSLVLIGPVSPRLDPAALDVLARRPNVHLLGARTRPALPPYLAHLDCALLPYVESSWSDHGSPLKLWDHLGAGPPIAASGYSVLREYGPPLVRYASPPADLPDTVAAALAAPESEREARRAYAAENSWEDRAAVLSSWLDAL